MSLYPSLEDMKVDQMAQVQNRIESQYAASVQSTPAMMPYPLNPTSAPSSGHTSGALYPVLNDYMGLDVSPETLARNVPEYSVPTQTQADVAVYQPRNIAPLGGMVAPLSGQSLGLQKAQVTHGVRELTLCKDASGKVGLRVKAINKGIFVCLVIKGSPAALAGLRFGDQILQINGTTVAGFTMDQVHELLRKSPVNGISVVVRDRPFERTVTLHKDSTGHIGFQFKGAKVIGLVKDSSAARNGLLTEHHLLEVNAQNVVGLKDKDISALIDKGGNIITITVIPSFVYDHMVKSMANDLVKNAMDHTVPTA